MLGQSTSASKLKTIIGPIVAIATLVIAVMLVITSRESIPDRARFFVNKKERFIVPEPLPGRYIFHRLPDASDAALVRFDGSVTWRELRQKDSPYHDFTLPKTAEWDRFSFYGEEVSLLRSIVFPPPSRWDGEGRWRY